jgi:hypothetical protein
MKSLSELHPASFFAETEKLFLNPYEKPRQSWKRTKLEGIVFPDRWICIVLKKRHIQQ